MNGLACRQVTCSASGRERHLSGRESHEPARSTGRSASPAHWLSRAAAFGISLVVGILALGVVGAASALAQSADSTPPTYVAVIDAGSSGTRIALFTDGASGKMAPESVLTLDGEDDGLDKYADRPSAAGPDAVAPLLAALRPALAERGVEPSAVPVSLLATAGLRTLQRTRPKAVRAILASAREAITGAGFPARRVTVMSGQNEATYSWIDANALRTDAGGEFGRIGIAEVGGASAQIAFATTRESGRSTTTVRIGGRPYPIVAISYLGLGVNAARATMATTTTGPRPCYPNNASGTDPSAYDVGPGRTVASRRSDFRYATCARTYRGVIGRVGADTFNARETGRVAPAQVRELPGFGRTTFVGVSAISFTLKDFDVPESSNQSARLRRNVTSTCTGTDAWSKVVARYGGSTGTFTQVACANATYQNEWLFGRVGLGISSKRFSQGAELGGGSPSWSRGYALSVLDP